MSTDCNMYFRNNSELVEPMPNFSRKLFACLIVVMFFATVCARFTFAQATAAKSPSITDREIQAIENGLITKVKIDGRDPKIYRLLDRMKFFNVPGVSIAVFNKGKIIWRKGYGLADVSQNKIVDPETKFQAASISKAVTAFALLKLAEKRNLDLDRDVNEYLTGWKVPENEFTATEKVTIRRLLNHTAGISVSGFTGYKKSETIPSLLEILDGKGNTPKIVVESVPGSKFSYSGGGYLILQKLIEDISKKSFERFMKNEILKPLKMDNSSFDQYLQKDRSLAYDNGGKEYEGGWLIMPELAPAGLWTTPSDLAKFCLAVQNSYQGVKGAYLSQKLSEEMLKPVNNWGLGLGIRGKGKSIYFFHGGRNAGFNNIILNLYNEGTGIVVMTNADQGGTLRDEIIRAYSDYYDIRILPPPRIIQALALTKDQLAEYAGKYRWKENYFLEASINESNNLILRDMFDGKINVFVPVEKDSFVDVNTGEEAIFRRNTETGQIIDIFYNKIDTFIRLSDQLNKLPE